MPLRLRSRLGLARVELGLLLPFHRRQGVPFGLAQRVQAGRARDQFLVLLGSGRDLAHGQPVAEGFARSLVVGLRDLEPQARLGQRVLRGFFVALRVPDGLAQARDRRRIHEVLQRLVLFDLGKVADDGPTQTDQKPRKDQRNEPQRAVEPGFGQTKRLVHAILL